MIRLSLAYLRDRALNTALNIILLALGVASLVILLLFSSQLENRFDRDSQGIDMVVGAKGSPLQLILSSVYHVDIPTGNVPLETVDLLRRQMGVAEAIPLALGDSFRSFRIVGTEPAYPALMGAALADGRMFAKPMEAVIGAEVAARTGAGLGQRFVGGHGMGGGDEGPKHEETPFIVVGRLKPTGTVIDRLILTRIESVWAVHGIEAPHDEHAGEDHDHAHEAGGHDHEGETAEEHAAHVSPAEVTSVLVRFGSPIAAVRLPGFINRQTNLQSAVPAVEVSRLLALVGVGLDAVRAFAVLLMLTAGLSIFVALLTALKEREGDMAMLRVIGASRAAIIGQVASEGLILAAAGTALGLALGHGVIGLAAANFEQLHQLGLNALAFHPGEAIIAAAALAIGLIAALIPAFRVLQSDIAETLANSR
ncbi:ABC transporter permease [Sandarakinorhabdus cyanobacteriorum]|uniref:ABC transporter permease n=1 Tax=Sandarakinorhabdus cyanobacteriorum TaxID=1981098 RepID=A0A255Z0P0_9SPHN|nr:ABC transporter permease [Sandarakinorhabdus cyanobacteriorum]OYQ35063.1 ABC transporter permease [Sandarakinorhabdus cyanobacteriorum]